MCVGRYIYPHTSYQLSWCLHRVGFDKSTIRTQKWRTTVFDHAPCLVIWSGRQDSNLRRHAPKACALPTAPRPDCIWCGRPDSNRRQGLGRPVCYLYTTPACRLHDNAPSCLPGSNRRPAVYKTAALPSELKQHGTLSEPYPLSRRGGFASGRWNRWWAYSDSNRGHRD